jgi:hypothetical protein
MSNPIVTVNVNIAVAPAPSTLQKTGAFVSQGGTITSPGTKSLLTQLSDLTPLLTPAKANASISQVSSTVTVTTEAPHGFTIGDSLNLTIAGVTPAGYNGTFLCSITGASSFTYQLSASPGSETVPGTYVPAEVNSLVERATTFFAQGAAQSVYVLELGPDNANDGVTFLTNWIEQNPNVFYSYLVPRFWDGNASFISFLANFNATGSKTYFFVTTTLATWTLYPTPMKCLILLIEAPVYGAWPANALTSLSAVGTTVTATTATNHGVSPGQYFSLSGSEPAAYNGTFLAQQGTSGDTLVFTALTAPGMETALGTLVQSQYASAGVGATEFSLASVFRVTLNYAPSSTNKVTQLNQAFVFGVTPFPTQGNNSLINQLLAAGINLIGTGAAGGISGTLVQGGATYDGNPFKYWYSIDWTQINIALSLNAAIINGANNPQNPVDYNQFGINTLQQAAVSTMSSGIADGLVLNPIAQTRLDAADLQTALDIGTYDGNTIVNADPFASYTTENPNDYAAGIYNGISIDYTPLRGFESITVNVSVSNFAQ